MADRLALGVLTSGGDAQGMNAAVRAVVRTALRRGATPYAIHDGYQGMVEGGALIRPLGWDEVGGILQRGGTVIGTARCDAFRARAGRLRAAANLLARGIDRLAVIGGDGSLTGAATLREEWPELLAELAAAGLIDAELPARHPALRVVGLVGSIDNDFAGIDTTIGADSALHRITAAIDAISSTAASHQRAFVVEVMGRRCGYLALAGAIAGGADYLLIPELPPAEGWQDELCELLRAGRRAGRRDSIVIVAEGARDRAGNPISSTAVRRLIEERLGEDTRVTILGHVQRGGTPSAFDRWMATLLGRHAAIRLLDPAADPAPVVIGMRYNRLIEAPLLANVAETRRVADLVAAGDYAGAMARRSSSFADLLATFDRLARALPGDTRPPRRLRLAVLHAGAPAPGMNTAVRAAVRLGLEQGHTMLGVRNGLAGLAEGQIEELSWGSVDGWHAEGGAELGISRRRPEGRDLYAIARRIETQAIDGLLLVGGWDAYTAAATLVAERGDFPAFERPIVCVPASIDNNLPGSDLSIGADTALNTIMNAVDNIKRSAVASRRCFVVEVMGRYCGYLALMSGLATGAERVYLHEEGVHLSDLQADLQRMIAGFAQGKRLSLMIRNEQANELYTTGFMTALFEEEGQDRFDVRPAILGHMQQGGDPSPFDRILATRLAVAALGRLTEACAAGVAPGLFLGVRDGSIAAFSLDELTRMADPRFRRPREQWWLALRPVIDELAQPAPAPPAAQPAAEIAEELAAVAP